MRYIEKIIDKYGLRVACEIRFFFEWGWYAAPVCGKLIMNRSSEHK